MLGLIIFQAHVTWNRSAFVLAFLVAKTFVIVAVIVAVVADT
jgi:hypothetical protein